MSFMSSINRKKAERALVKMLPFFLLFNANILLQMILSAHFEGEKNVICKLYIKKKKKVWNWGLKFVLPRCNWWQNLLILFSSMIWDEQKASSRGLVCTKEFTRFYYNLDLTPLCVINLTVVTVETVLFSYIFYRSMTNACDSF